MANSFVLNPFTGQFDSISTLSLGTANGLSLTSQVLSLDLSSTSTTGALSSTDWNTFNNKQDSLTIGNLTDVGTDGITVTGGTGAVIGTGTSLSQHVADTTHNGYLSSTDWNTFNNKQAALTPGSISTSTTGVTVGSGTASTVGPNVTVNVQTASGSQPGLLSAADWTTFNNKQSTLTLGDLTDVGTDGITVTGGIGAVVGSGTSLSQHVADTTHNGYLSSTDWNTFNGKQPAGTYLTSVAVASSNGFTGSSSGGTTPTLTLTTSVTGVLKGNGTAISAATAGTDYSAGTSGLSTGIIKSTTGTGALTIAVAGDFPTLNQNTSGSAASLSATLVATSGGTGQSTYTTGDTLYASASNTLSKLAIGSSGQVLTVSGGVPVWQGLSTIRSELQFYAFAGLGSSSTVIPYFSTTSRNTGSDITFVQNSTVGLECTIVTTGLYYVSFSYDPGANTVSECGISVNSTQLSTALDSINAADRFAYSAASAIATVVVDFNCSWAGLLTAGDVVRPHTNGAPGGSRAFFKIVKIGN